MENVTLGSKAPTNSEMYVSEKQRQREELSSILDRVRGIHFRITGNSGQGNETSSGGGIERIKSLHADLETDVAGTEYLINGLKEVLSGIESFI